MPNVEQELLTLPEHLRSPLVFSGVPVGRSFVFCIIFWRLLFVPLSFFFWPLYYLSFFNIRHVWLPLWYLQTFLIDRFFVEQVEEPTIYLSLYGFLWSFGIQYKAGKSSYSSLIGKFIEDMNDLWFANISSLSKLVF